MANNKLANSLLDPVAGCGGRQVHHTIHVGRLSPDLSSQRANDAQLVIRARSGAASTSPGNPSGVGTAAGVPDSVTGVISPSALRSIFPVCPTGSSLTITTLVGTATPGSTCLANRLISSESGVADELGVRNAVNWLSASIPMKAWSASGYSRNMTRSRSDQFVDP